MRFKLLLAPQRQSSARCQTFVPSPPLNQFTRSVRTCFILQLFLKNLCLVSTYFCLYGECKAVAAQKTLMMTHIQRKHLGIAIACKFCGKQWWTDCPFTPPPHMEKEHPELSKLNWLTPVDPKKVAEEEA